MSRQVTARIWKCQSMHRFSLILMLAASCLNLCRAVKTVEDSKYPKLASLGFRSHLRQAVSPEFQFYVLAQSSQAVFCEGHIRKFPGCKDPESYWRTHFTLHGLWPQYDDAHSKPSPYPHDCQGSDFDRSVVDQVGLQKMVTYWPDVRFNPTDKRYDEFWEHEWSKHGTCSGLTQYNYTIAAIHTVEKFGTASLISKSVGKSVKLADIVEAYGGHKMVVLQCKNGSQLSQVMTCWGVDGSKFPTQRVACPESVLREHHCMEDEVTIADFPTSSREDIYEELMQVD